VVVEKEMMTVMGGGQICYVGGGQDSGEIRFKAKG